MTSLISAAAVAAQIKEFRQAAKADLAAATRLESEAEKRRGRAETLNQCADNLEKLLKQTDENAEKSASGGASNLRYQKQNITADMIAMIFSNPAIEKQAVLDMLRQKEKTRGTGGKMLKRALENDDVSEDGNGRLSLTEQGAALWRQSPLFRQ